MEAISAYLETQIYPKGLSKSQKETLGKEQPTFAFKKVFCITLAVGKFQSFLIPFYASDNPNL